ncbi:hypothetical protein GOP47_0004678 [Adiantum capillus-veneris]|uniref:F-box domain-containing protein n=1 Tax=Adiantum capillus-veneris TaxID=13818 RepID=A0A9D4V7V6_ADICA|nr:hypothetical protein GOP47_0004678 [Adiantum capillus-veneris]
MSEEDDASEKVRRNQAVAGDKSLSSSTWDKLPDDLHARVIALLPIPSIIRNRAVCQDWNRMIVSQSFKRLHEHCVSNKEKPWLFMCSSFNCRENCCAYDPNLNVWHTIPLTFAPVYMRLPLIAVGGLLFIKGAAPSDTSNQGTGSSSRLAVCNPITRTWRVLPPMIRGRLNSLVGVFGHSDAANFTVVIAGGTYESGGNYECTTEVYDSISDSWCITGTVPREYTVKITVWTSKTIYCKGILYCLTSARPYNIMAYDMKKGVWEEVRIPQPQVLFCSFLVQRREQLLLVGGARCEEAGPRVHIWELRDNGNRSSSKRSWVEIERIPPHHFQRFCEGKSVFDLKCAGSGDMLYFYKDSHSDILLCDLSQSPTTWNWLPTCPLSARFFKFSIRGLLVKPSLDGDAFMQK